MSLIQSSNEQQLIARISPLEHRGSTFIKVEIPNIPSAKKLIRLIQGRKWSKTHVCWYLPNSYDALNELRRHFEVEGLSQLKRKQKPLNDNIGTIGSKIEVQPDRNISNADKGDTIRLERHESKSLRAFVPYDKKGWISSIKEIPGRKWVARGKYWLLPNVKDTHIRLQQKIGGRYLDYRFTIEQDIPKEFLESKRESKCKKAKYKLNGYQERALSAFEEKLTLEHKSHRTIKTYKALFRHFLLYFSNTIPSKISKEQIEKYLSYKKQENASDSQMNQLVNALNCFFIRILNQEAKVCQIIRPKKKKKLPNVFSLEEIELLLKSCKNIKHKTLLILVYSGGLRRSEVLNLRIEDINFNRKSIYIKNAKGGKDRFTFLAKIAEKYLREYFMQYKPKYYLFEGQVGGRYGESSIQKVFDEARRKSKVNRFVTLHGLRHSFATHLIEKGIPLHVVQELLGHGSIKTTEIYLHISNKFRKELRSPLDDLEI